jgi:hypothetical protein
VLVEEGDCKGITLQACLDNWVNSTETDSTDFDLYPCEFDFIDRHFLTGGISEDGTEIFRPALMFQHNCPNLGDFFAGFRIDIAFRLPHSVLNEILFDDDHFNVFYDFNPKGCKRIDPDDDEIINCVFDIIARDNANPTEKFNNFGIMFGVMYDADVWSYTYETITLEDMIADGYVVDDE